MVEEKTFRLIILMSVLATSACVNIPTRVHDSGVRIYPISNDTGSVRSVAFWTDREGLSLRGEVPAKPADQNALAGHIDISITEPDGSNTVCATANFDTDPKQGLKSFSHRFESLPPQGSSLRVWQHSVAASHDDCVS